MHSTLFTFLLALVATIALAAPVTQKSELVKRSFRVEHRGRPKPSVNEVLAQAYRKYGWEITWQTSTSDNSAATGTSPSGSTSGGNSDDGEVTATPVQSGSAYVAQVDIGGQMLNLDFDTGSSDLWVFSTELGAGAGTGHTLFNPQKSSSFTPYQGGSWMTQYGDGSSASGNVGFDTVSIGGATVQKQCVELAEKTNGFEQLTQSDGLLGLGFSSINQVKPQQQQTFWENILPQLEQPVFTADLDENASGSYEFGSIDSTKFTGQLHYTPVDNSEGYWMIESGAFSINGQQQQCSNCSPLIADTGTSLILLDQDVVQAYYNQVQSAAYDSSTGLFMYSCGATLPDFGLAIGNGYMANLAGSALKYLDAGNGQCIGGIQWNGGAGLSIAGDVFFRQYFAVFDGGNMQLGVAPKAGQ